MININRRRNININSLWTDPCHCYVTGELARAEGTTRVNMLEWKYIDFMSFSSFLIIYDL